MTAKKIEKEEIFPKGTGKTYGLMEMVEGESHGMSKQPEDTIFTFPHLFMPVLICSVFTVSLLMLAAYFFNAPLEEIANPARPLNPAVAPWYFLGLQELVSYDAFIGGVVVPGVSLLGIVAIPYLDRNPLGAGAWFSGKRPVAIALFTLFIIANILLICVGNFFRGPNWVFIWP